MEAPEAAAPPRFEPGPVTAQTSAFLQALAAKAVAAPLAAGVTLPAATAAAAEPPAAFVSLGHSVPAASRRKHPSFAPSSGASQRDCSIAAEVPVNGMAEGAAEAAEWEAEPSEPHSKAQRTPELLTPHSVATGPQPWLEEGPRSGKKRRLTELMAVGVEARAPQAATPAASRGPRKQPSSGDSSYGVSAANGGTTESGSLGPDLPLSRVVLPPRRAAMTAAANLKQQALSTSSDATAPSLGFGEQQPKRSAIGNSSSHVSKAKGSGTVANGSRKKSAEAGSGSKGLSPVQLSDFILPPRRAAVAAADGWKQQATNASAAAAATSKGGPAPSAGRRAGSAGGGGGGRRGRKQEADETAAVCARALPWAEASARARMV